MEKLTIGIVFGGRSGEHEISVRSAAAVIEQISKEIYEVVPIAITREGHWCAPSDSNREARKSNKKKHKKTRLAHRPTGFLFLGRSSGRRPP